MEELKLIIDDLKACLAKKKTDLGASLLNDVHVYGEISKRQDEIGLLENATKLVRPDPAFNEAIITGFQADADVIRTKIDAIASPAH